MIRNLALVFSLFALAVPAGAQHSMPFHGPSAWFSVVPNDSSDSYLGVYLKDVTPETVDELSLPAEYGALIAETVVDSPAEQAGLLADDVAVSWNGTRIESARQLKRMVTETPVGRTVELGIIRDGNATEIPVEIGQREATGPGMTPFPGFNDRSPSFHSWHPPIDQNPYDDALFPPMKPRLGISMQPMTGQLGTFFGLKDGETGVLINSVIEDSLAAEAGIAAGDVITAIDGESVTDPMDVQRKIRQADGLTDLTLVRDKEVVHIQVDLSAPEADDGEDEDDQDEDDDEDDDTLRPEIYPKSAM